jgi:hypothetical protein
LLAELHRPYGADHVVGTGFPTLKRWANKPCAYGAVKTHLARQQISFMRLLCGGFWNGLPARTQRVNTLPDLYCGAIDG